MLFVLNCPEGAVVGIPSLGSYHQEAQNYIGFPPKTLSLM